MHPSNENNSTPVRLPAGGPLSILNARNQEFWEEQNKLAVARMSDTAIRQTAMQDLGSEQSRRIPVYFRKSVEKALEDAAAAKERCDRQSKGQFQTEFSRKGGRASKADLLQQFILDG